MTFYRQLRDDYIEMRAQLDELQRQYEENQAKYKRMKAQSPEERVPNDNEALYYRIRELFNHPDDSYLDGVLYFFINKTAYSGMIRYNNSGEYNVPLVATQIWTPDWLHRSIVSYCVVLSYTMLIIVRYLQWHKRMILFS